ncbi:MAG: transglutaminase family protein [Actinomycetota bacterium]|nr:transglutaminase family protein [Actinomycetota bacterium]
MNAHPSRRVSARLVFRVHRQAEVILQVTAADVAALQAEEELTAQLDGAPVKAAEVAMTHGGRAHLLALDPGWVTVEYGAVVPGATLAPEVTEADRVTYLRPSRYAESDRLTAVARAEFSGIRTGQELLAAVSSWVGTRLSYVPGSSRPIDGAVETLLLRQGVCRDYGHLVVALLRALDVPARLAAVYAPGLEPMDFHAVAEALVGGQWRVVDATLLAPRSSLIRIATGRDAAGTAFMSSYGGAVELTETAVTATVGGALPSDDVHDLVSIS